MSDIAGKGCEQLIPLSDRKSLQEIERSIITKHRKDIWGKFIKAIKEFQLIEDGDKIAVAISGGKDSLLMAKLFQELKRHGRDNFQLEFIAMDPGYHDSIKQLLLDNCQYLNIPVHVFDSGIFRIVDNVAKDYPCYMCAKMRRGALYKKAQELGCNKLALGHHFNDVIETTMLNLLYTGNFSTMLPKLKSLNFEGLELIRPLYHVEEEAIIDFIDHSGIWPLNCACMVAAKKIGTKRHEVKALIKEMKTKFESVDRSIFRATQNVNMEAILGWQKDGKSYSYLDDYHEE
ncbi:tRNA 2-thiocytidine biosynthesis protein TtcA [Clostridium aceticum]|uniref:tRNA 2-thiocytidine biosynthesis protein TtcA n=1 Tax=Clostridium aceticum TaxID=84022 RepID=A0A0D8I8A0_9CLOT|nr:ATP-binding protein [Clostridium aceticum]AKL94625.1 tRNA 2-thiocytidine biosynthesis protein TtcA [Clostridium aceticum]KJF26473.1 restriction endonuclease EcoEI subunit S [Clostridium aceticum]